MFLCAWALLSVSVFDCGLCEFKTNYKTDYSIWFSSCCSFIVGGTFDDEEENRAILIGLTLVLIGGCISTIGLTSQVGSAMLFGCHIVLDRTLCCSHTMGILLFGVMSYCLGVGIGCVMVAVRSVSSVRLAIILSRLMHL